MMQITMPFRKYILYTGAGVILSLSSAACTPTITQRGHFVEQYKLEQIQIGESLRSDVLRIMGSPTTQSTFDTDIWYYIGQETAKRGILDPKVEKERIVEVKFNPETGLVDSVQDINDGRIAIPVSRDETATRGNETSILQQFLGNLGRFNSPAGQAGAN